MNDAQVYAMVVGALGVGAGAVKLAQMALRRNGNKKNGPAGQMSKDAWILIFEQLFEKHLKPFQEKHDKLSERLEKMSEGFQGNRQMLVDKLDKIAEAMREEAKSTRHDLRNTIAESISRAYMIGKGGKSE